MKVYIVLVLVPVVVVECRLEKFRGNERVSDGAGRIGMGKRFREEERGLRLLGGGIVCLER